MGAKGKRKGDRNERIVCRMLSEWWYQKDYSKVKADKLPFRRTPGSGGWDAKRAPGDILVPRTCKLHLEIKAREEWSWDQYFNPKTKKWYVNKYWEQTLKDLKPNKIPMLVFTKNFHPFYIRMYKNDFNELNCIPRIQLEGDDTAFSFLEDFLENVSPKLLGKKSSKF